MSWIWDADFELLAGRVRHATCSGTRAEEMALRLKYAGVTRHTVVDRDLGRSLDAAVAAGEPGRPLYALPTYTALLEISRRARATGPGRAMGSLSDYVFGYGSLVADLAGHDARARCGATAAASASPPTTARRSPATSATSMPRRRRAPRRFRGLRRPRDAPGDTVNGPPARRTAALAALDGRERNYARVEVTAT